MLLCAITTEKKTTNLEKKRAYEHISVTHSKSDFPYSSIERKDFIQEEGLYPRDGGGSDFVPSAIPRSLR